MLLAIAGLGVIINTFWMRFFSLEILIAIAGLIITSRRELPHHTAPIITAIYAMTIAGFQRIYQWHWKSLSLGRIVILAVLCTYLSLGCLIVPMSRWLYDPTKTHYPEFRKNILSVLHNEGGRHLIIVKYKDNVSGDDTLFNWVYNDADIDASSVVWAMDMGPEKNRELLDYFKARKVWLLRGNTEVPFLVPYGRARFMESSSAK
jgi:hypothetical protein